MSPFLATKLPRRGLTLLEVVAVVGIIGILVAITIPAVQSSRESARQVQCKNNLRQILVGTQSFHQSNKTLPSFYNGTSLTYPLQEWDLFHMHSWRVPLLPHVEQESIHRKIDFESLATDPENLPIAKTPVPVFICPSGADPKSNMGWGLKHQAYAVSQPPEERYRYHVVRSDYDAIAGIHDPPSANEGAHSPDMINHIRWGVWGWPVFDNGSISGAKLLKYRAGRFRDVRDGLSNTITVAERGGKPIDLLNGKPNITESAPNADYPGQVGWSASNTFTWGINQSGVGVNISNSRGIYSLHPSGAHVGMADGSVRFLSDSTDFKTLVSMFSRSERD